MNRLRLLERKQLKAMAAPVVASPSMLRNKCTPRTAHGTNGASLVPIAIDLL